MKKWGWLLGGVVLAVTVMAVGTSEDSTVTVSGIRLHTQRAESTVSCSGIVEAGDVIGVTASIPCVVEEVLVEEGQAVKAGDPVVKIDKEASRYILDERDAQALSLSVMPDELCAETDGIVVGVTTKTGDVLEVGVPGVMLAERRSLLVRVAIPEKHLNTVKCGQSVTISGKGLYASSYRGTLEEIAASVSTVGGTSAVSGRVVLKAADIDDSFRIGLTTKVNVITASYEDCVVIPHEAVMRDQDDAYVYVWRNGVVEKQTVHIQAEVQDGVLVQESLSGTVVVTQPSALPSDLAAVRVSVEEENG